MKKRRHHYVWRNYLRPWANDEQIWCLRDSSCFITNLMNIGQEKDFYKLKSLTKENISFIKKLAIDPSPKHLEELNKGWVDIFNFIFKVQEHLDKKGINDPELERMLDEQTYNLEEDLHGSIESNSIKYLEAILAEDLSFYEQDNDCIEFLHFLCIQYMRTNRVKQSVIAATQNSKLLNIEDIWNVLTHIFATNMGWSIYADRKSFNLVLLKNCTELSFITGDQPIVNTHANNKELLEERCQN